MPDFVRLIHGISRAFAIVAAICVLGLVILTAVDVSSRVLTGRSVPGMIEYGEMLMVALVFLGLAYTQRTGQHVSVTLMASRLPLRLAAALEAAGLLLVIGLLTWLLYATLANAVHSFQIGEYRFGITTTPVWPARFLIPAGVAALIGELITDVVERAATASGLRPPSTPERPADSVKP